MVNAHKEGLSDCESIVTTSTSETVKRDNLDPKIQREMAIIRALLEERGFRHYSVIYDRNNRANRDVNVGSIDTGGDGNVDTDSSLTSSRGTDSNDAAESNMNVDSGQSGSGGTDSNDAAGTMNVDSNQSGSRGANSTTNSSMSTTTSMKAGGDEAEAKNNSMQLA
jgi:hypothetical protein